MVANFTYLLSLSLDILIRILVHVELGRNLISSQTPTITNEVIDIQITESVTYQNGSYIGKYVVTKKY